MEREADSTIQRVFKAFFLFNCPMHWLEALDGNLGDNERMAFEPRLQKEGIVSAIKKSVEYLASIEYLAAEEKATGEEDMPVFKRTGISARSL